MRHSLLGGERLFFRPTYTAVRGPDHWAIFAQQECLSKETLSLASLGLGLPSPQGLFPPAKLRTLVYLPPKYNLLCVKDTYFGTLASGIRGPDSCAFAHVSWGVSRFELNL